jgi:hypothetical protein
MKGMYKWAEKKDVEFAEDKLKWICFEKEKEKEKHEIESHRGTVYEDKEIIRWLKI